MRQRVVRAEGEPGRRCLALAEPLDPESGLRSFDMDQAFGVFASLTPIVPGPEARVPEGLERVR